MLQNPEHDRLSAEEARFAAYRNGVLQLYQPESGHRGVATDMRPVMRTWTSMVSMDSEDLLRLRARHAPDTHDPLDSQIKCNTSVDE